MCTHLQHRRVEMSGIITTGPTHTQTPTDFIGASEFCAGGLLKFFILTIHHATIPKLPRSPTYLTPKGLTLGNLQEGMHTLYALTSAESFHGFSAMDIIPPLNTRRQPFRGHQPRGRPHPFAVLAALTIDHRHSIQLPFCSCAVWDCDGFSGFCSCGTSATTSNYGRW